MALSRRLPKWGVVLTGCLAGCEVHAPPQGRGSTRQTANDQPLAAQPTVAEAAWPVGNGMPPGRMEMYVRPYANSQTSKRHRVTLLSVGYRTTFEYNDPPDPAVPPEARRPQPFAVPSLEVEYLVEPIERPDDSFYNQVHVSLDGGRWLKGRNLAGDQGNYQNAPIKGYALLDANHLPLTFNRTNLGANLDASRYYRARVHGIPARAKRVSLRVFVDPNDAAGFEFLDIPLEPRVERWSTPPSGRGSEVPEPLGPSEPAVVE